MNSRSRDDLAAKGLLENKKGFAVRDLLCYKEFKQVTRVQGKN